jgi:hypothetical protein
VADYWMEGLLSPAMVWADSAFTPVNALRRLSRSLNQALTQARREGTRLEEATETVMAWEVPGMGRPRRRRVAVAFPDIDFRARQVSERLPSRSRR